LVAGSRHFLGEPTFTFLNRLKMRALFILVATALALTWAKTPLQVKVNRGLPLSPPVQLPKKVKVQSGFQETANSREHRLPVDNPTPVHYELKLTPIFEDPPAGYEENSVYGEVFITVDVHVAVKVVTLNLHRDVVVLPAPLPVITVSQRI